MKRVKSTLLMFLMLIVLLPGCSSDDDGTVIDPDSEVIDDNDDGEEEDNDSTTTRAIQVILPEGSTLDLTTTTILSLTEEFEVNANGSTMANITDVNRSLVILQDADENPILMGQLTADRLELSMQTTVETALYFGLGTIFLPEEVRERYVEEAANLPNTDAFISQSENMFVANPTDFLSSTGFIDALRGYIDNLNERDIIDIRTSINVDDTGTRSGISVVPSDGAANTVSLANTYRRRAHAFIYKVAFTDENNVETILINDVAAQEASFAQDVVVEPVTGITAIIGSFQNIAGGKGLEFARKVSAPRPLPIEDNENSAIYNVRVIGPALNGAQLTDVEENKLRQLELETFGFDIVLPLFLSVVNQQELLADIEEEAFQPFINALTTIAGSVGSVNEPLNQGNFRMALTEFIFALQDGVISGPVLSGLLDEFFDVLRNNVSNDLLAGDSIFRDPDFAENFLKVLGAADFVFQAIDILRVFNDISSSNLLEEWEVTATRNNVRLAPEAASIGVNEERTFRAFVSNASLAEEQFIEYEWSTTGAFGRLRDNSGFFVDSFTTTRDEVSYFAEEFSGPNQNDEVRVEAFLVQTGSNPSRTRINDATAVVNTQPSGFVIRPTTRIIGGDDDIRLYIEDREGNTLLRDNSDFDYRVAWNTPGQHGAFDGTQRDVSFINQDDVIYSALDEDVDTGEETVTARIFARRKGETGSFTFLGDASATIIISNFEIVEYELTNEAYFFVTDAAIFWRSGFIIPREERAVSYSVEILEFFAPNGVTPSPQTGRVFTWDNDAEPDTFLRIFGEELGSTGFLEMPGNSSGSFGDFSLVLFGGGQNSPNTGFNTFQSSYAGTQRTRGRAKVTITLDGRL